MPSVRAGIFVRTQRRLFPTIVGAENLRQGYREARRGKRRRPDVAMFCLREEVELARLGDELASGQWRPEPLRTIIIRDPKLRLIAASTFADRVVHHGIHRVIAPILCRRFVTDTFACLPGRGTHRAVLRFQHGLRHFRWVARLDVARYFMEIDWDLLLGLVGTTIRDQAVLELLEKVLQIGAGLYSDASLLTSLGLDGRYQPQARKGLPIGSLTSQLFANLYLDGLDHFVKRQLKVPLYIRYMDDAVLFANHRSLLIEQVERCREWLQVSRRLEAKANTGRVASTGATFRFLAQTIDRQHCRPSSRAIRRLRCRLEALARADLTAGARAQAEQEILASIRSLLV